MDMTIDDEIITELRKAPLYFNELCRLLGHHRLMVVYKHLIMLERKGVVKSELIHSSFEVEMRWVRQFSLVKDE